MVKLRHSTIERVFGNLINYYGLRKIPTIGMSGAHKCMLMSAVAYNLKKLLKHLTHHGNSNVQAVRGKACLFSKSLLQNFIQTVLPHPAF